MIDDYSFHGRKHIKRDYYNKTFQNPYFNRKQQKLGTKFNTKLYIEIMTAGFLVYLIIYSSLFKVKEITVQGTEMINSEEIRLIADREIGRLKLFVFPGRNLIFINNKKIANQINAKYALENLEINKSWQRIDIKVVEKVVNLIAFNSNSYYFIDSSGAVTKELSAEEVNAYRQKFPLVYFDKELKISDKPISDRAVNYILELDKELKAQGIKVKNYESGEVDRVNLLTDGGWRAYFSINTTLSTAVENLMTVLNKKLTGKKFEYIDVRLADRVSYYPED
jgi:cell division septal protein FtsQ